MDDRKLLELAAKAAGIEIRRGKGHQSDMLFRQVEDSRGIVTGVEWSPLKDDGDCARMEASCSIDVEWHAMGVVAQILLDLREQTIRVREPYADHDGDRNAARRRASTRAAAAMAPAKVAPLEGEG